MSIKEQAIEMIEANKISSTEIGDVLGKTGQIEGVHALNAQMFKAGEVKMIYAINNSNYEVHKQLAECDDIKDKILFVYNVNCNRAVFGDLVSKYIMLYKRAKAIVINGKLRDAHTLINLKSADKNISKFKWLLLSSLSLIFPSSGFFRGFDGVLRVSTSIISPYPMKAEGCCLCCPRRFLS